MYQIQILVSFCCLILIGSSASGQSSMSWFEPSSITDEKDIITSSDCQIAKEDNTGLYYEIEFEQKPFFVYTHPQVRGFVQDGFLMECQANIQQVDENKFLILEYKINSSQAKISYGNLEKGEKIKVDLINKEHIYLENIERSRGKVRKSDNYTLYYGTYAISKDNMNMLKKHSIDKITVLWEEGIETYEIQNIDLIKNQLNFLEKR